MKTGSALMWEESLAMLPLCLMLGTAVGCNGKSSADAGAGTSCGISALGACSGTVLSFCDPDTGDLDTIDCAQEVAGEPFTCALVDSYDGYDCEAPTGQSCEFFDSSDGANDVIFCQGVGPACLISPSGTSVCKVGIPQCLVYGDGGSPPATCTGGDGGDGSTGPYLVPECNSTQPILYDCTAAGGSCLNQHCINQALGAPCDDGATILCANGLNCIPVDGGATVCGT